MDFMDEDYDAPLDDVHPLFQSQPQPSAPAPVRTMPVPLTSAAAMSTAERVQARQLAIQSAWTALMGWKAARRC